MPVYEYECESGHQWEEYRPLAKYSDVSPCPKKRCTKIGKLNYSLVSVHPDNMWSGVDTQFGHFTSRTAYERLLKERGLVTIDKKELDKTRKKVYNTKQDNKRKQAQATNDFLNQQLASVEISPDGNTVKERNKYARKRQ